MKEALLFTTHPAHWPWQARIVLLLGTALGCAGSGLAMSYQEALASQVSMQHRHLALQAQLRQALERSAGLPLLQRHAGELEQRLLETTSQLWPPASAGDGLLQAKLTRRAKECALSLESFRPLNLSAMPEEPNERAEVILRGEYDALLRFIELITALPMPVQVDATSIVIADRDALPILQMTLTVSLTRRSDAKKDPL